MSYPLSVLFKILTNAMTILTNATEMRGAEIRKAPITVLATPDMKEMGLIVLVSRWWTSSI